jgi:hypothetical protein
LCINPKALSLVNCSFHSRIEAGSQLQFATTPKEADCRAVALLSTRHGNSDFPVES